MNGVCGSCGSNKGHIEGRCRNCGGPFSPRERRRPGSPRSRASMTEREYPDIVRLIGPKTQRAKIVSSGQPGRSEPNAELADGRVMPMGWNMGKTYPVGTEGTAEYVITPSASLWRFTPDE